MTAVDLFNPIPVLEELDLCNRDGDEALLPVMIRLNPATEFDDHAFFRNRVAAPAPEHSDAVITV